jgi:hypothetical protein
MTDSGRCAFRSGYDLVGQMPSFGQETIAAEPMLRFAPIPWARRHAGPIVQAFLDALPSEYVEAPHATVRARTVHLRPGMGPGNALWHLDGLEIVRGDDWTRRRPDFWRFACQFGGIAPTRLAVGRFDAPAYPAGRSNCAIWHDHVEKGLAEGTLREDHAAEGAILRLGSHSIHCTGIADRAGFRVFVDLNSIEEGSVATAIEGIYDEVHNSFVPRTLAEADLMSPYRRALRG